MPAGGEVGTRAEAAEPVRRDRARVHAEPGENRAQVLGSDLGDAQHPRALACGGHLADEVDLGAAGKQGRGRPDLDHAIGEPKTPRRLADDAFAPREGIDRKVDVGFDACGNRLADVVRDRLQGGQRRPIGGLPGSGGAGGRACGFRLTGNRQEAIEVDAVEVDPGIQPRHLAALPGDRARRLALAQPNLQLARGDGVRIQAERAPGRELGAEGLRRQRPEIHGERIQQGAEVGRLGPYAAVERGHAVEALERALEQRAAPLAAQLRFERDRHGAVFADRGGCELELDRAAAHGELAVSPVGSVQRAGRKRRVDPLDPLRRRAVRMAIDDRAVRDARGVDPGQSRLGCRRLACFRLFRSLAGCALGEPIGAAVGEALKLDHGLHQLETGNGDLAAEERPERKLEIERADPRHVGSGRPRHVGDAKVGGLDRRRRQDGHRERAVDRNVTTGDSLQTLRDLGLVLLPIEKQRHKEERSDEESQYDERSVNEFHRRPCLEAGEDARSAQTAAPRSTPVNSPIHFV